jgi:proliferating cell nuclear antigen
MPKEKVKATVPKEGILDDDIKENVDFKGEIKEDEPEPVQEQEEGDSEVMFHLVAKAVLLKEMVELCSALVDDVILKIKKDEMKIVAVDHAHVCLVELTLGVDACDEYEATTLELGIELAKLYNILKLARENVIIDYDVRENRLIIQMDTLKRKMGVIDPAGIQDPSIPKLVVPGKFTISASHFSRTLAACEQISDHMRVTVDATGVELFAESNADTVIDKIPKDAKEVLEKLDAPRKFSSDYALDFLKNMTKGARKSIDFGMADDNPIKIEYSFAEDKGKAQYILAPRIEPEDVKEEKEKTK